MAIIILGKIKAIKKAIECECYLPALALALTLPDICGQIEYPELIYTSGQRKGQRKGREQYIKWYDSHVKPLYYITDKDAPTNQFDGYTCYALRCSLLHAGNFDLKSQNQKIPIDLFKLHVDKMKGQFNIHDSYHEENGKRIVDFDVYGICFLISYAANDFYNQNKDKATFEQFDSVVVDESWTDDTYDLLFE